MRVVGSYPGFVVRDHRNERAGESQLLDYMSQGKERQNNSAMQDDF